MNQNSHGARLREQREKLDMTQAAMASRCGVSREMWGKYERGIAAPRGAALAAMKRLGIDIDYVLTGQTMKLRDVLSQVKLSSEIAARYGMGDAEKAALQEEIFNALRAVAPASDEQQLLDHYRQATEAVRPAILAAVAALAGAQTTQAKAIEARQTFHGEVGQVVQAEGDIRNKKQVFNVGTRKKR